MFDIATRLQPASLGTPALTVPFDWRLAQPAPARGYPFTTVLATPPAPGVEVLQTYAMELEDTLATAVVISLFTDRRAGRDDALPPGNTERRGWVGEEFVSTTGEAWGSALWLLYSGKVITGKLEAAQFAAREALSWLVRDGIASRIEVTAEWAGERGDRLAVRPVVYQANNPSPVYDVLWGTSITRWAEL